MDQKDTDGPTSVDGSPNSDHRATQHERARLSAKGMSLVEEDSFKGIPQKRSALGFECVSPKYIGVPTEAIASFCILITLANDRVWMCLGKKEIPDPASLSHTFFAAFDATHHNQPLVLRCFHVSVQHQRELQLSHWVKVESTGRDPNSQTRRISPSSR
jgi:hypothetical protein